MWQNSRSSGLPEQWQARLERGVKRGFQGHWGAGWQARLLLNATGIPQTRGSMTRGTLRRGWTQQHAGDGPARMSNKEGSQRDSCWHVQIMGRQRVDAQGTHGPVGREGLQLFSTVLKYREFCKWVRDLFTYFEYQAKITWPQTRHEACTSSLLLPGEQKVTHFATEISLHQLQCAVPEPLRKLHHGTRTVETPCYLFTLSQIPNSRAYLASRTLSKRFGKAASWATIVKSNDYWGLPLCLAHF